MNVAKTIAGEVEAILPDVIALRRAIHAEPELGLFNPKTTERVMAALADLPLELRKGTSSSGIVAILRGAKPGRTVLLRGDMDALPMPEQSGLSFASQVPGVAHTCGHDSHTAMLAGAARLLCARRDQLCGSIMFMFQPGEEGHHGARYMIEDGLLDPFPDAAFALHMQPNGPHGVFTGRAGPVMAGFDNFEITVSGRGGHASMPHEALDPVPVAFEIGTAIHAMVTRRVNVFEPAVVTVGKTVAGTTHNVIPDTVQMFGTIRTISERTRRQVRKDLRRLVTNIGAAHGMAATLEIEEGYPVTHADPRACALGKAAAISLFGKTAWVDMETPIMGAEDFSYVLQKVPGAFFFLGAAHDGIDWTSCCGMHSPRMVLDESVMARGVSMHMAIATRFLDDGFGC